MLLLLRFTIPMERGRPLTFREWLPLKSEDSLTLSEDAGIQLRFWIDKACLDHVSDVDLNAIQQYGNIFIGRIYAEVSGIPVSDRLADAIPKLAVEKNWEQQHVNSTYGSAVIAEYQSIETKTYQMVIKRFNRLIEYGRAFKGQYWLLEYKADVDNIYSELAKLQAKVKIGESDWVDLAAPAVFHGKASIPDSKRLIGQDDWRHVREFVAGAQRTPFVGQLLASADQFHESEERRAALTEAVSALEIAINQFARQATPEKWNATLAGRSSAAQFRNHVEHLGMTCTVGYLFPVIFSEEQVPASVLKTCQDAIRERTAVVHGGQHDVKEDKLRSYLRDIRALCDKLRQFQAGDWQ